MREIDVRGGDRSRLHFTINLGGIKNAKLKIKQAGPARLRAHRF